MQNTIKRSKTICKSTEDNKESQELYQKNIKLLDSYIELLKSTNLTYQDKNLGYVYVYEKSPQSYCSDISIPADVYTEINQEFLYRNLLRNVSMYIDLSCNTLQCGSKYYNLTGNIINQIRQLNRNDIKMGLLKIKNSLTLELAYYTPSANAGSDYPHEKTVDCCQELNRLYQACMQLLKYENAYPTKDDYITVLRIYSSLLRYYSQTTTDQCINYSGVTASYYNKPIFLSNNVLAIITDPTYIKVALLSNDLLYPTLSSAGHNYVMSYNDIFFTR